MLEYQPGLCFSALLDGREQHLFLFVVRVVEHGEVGFGLHAEMQQQGGVAAVVEDHVGPAAAGPLEDAMGVFPVVVERLAFDGEDRRAARRHCGRGVILRRVDVAGRPAHVGAERLERLDQHGGLNGHVQ